MGLSFWHIIVVLLVVILMFGVGKGRIPQIMGDMGKGLRSFKSGLKGDLSDDDKPEQPKSLPEDKKGE